MRKMMIALAPVLLAMSSGVSAQAGGWRVSEASGDVRLVENGRARAAVRGALLSSGSTIATGAGARAVIVRGEEFVVISPRTQIRVPAAASQNAVMQLIEDFGTAVFKIRKKSNPHFGVQTPYLAAVVKGTTFTVTVGEQGSSVQVTEGAVQVSTLDGGASDLIRPGGIAQVGASDLYRLTVDGEGSKVIRSDKAPPEGSVSAKAKFYSGPAAEPAKIHANLGEGSKSLSDTTRGLVEGKAGFEIAHANSKDLELGRGNGKPETDDGNDKPGSDKPADDGKDKPSDDGKDKPADDGKDKPADDGKDKPADDGGKGDDSDKDDDRDGKGDDGREEGDKGSDSAGTSVDGKLAGLTDRAQAIIDSATGPN
jgi:hypothetical protein